MASAAQQRWVNRKPPPEWVEERRRTLAAAEVTVVEYDGRPFRLLRLPDAPPPDPLDEPRPVVGRRGYAQQIA